MGDAGLKLLPLVKSSTLNRKTKFYQASAPTAHFGPVSSDPIFFFSFFVFGSLIS